MKNVCFLSLRLQNVLGIYVIGKYMGRAKRFSYSSFFGLKKLARTMLVKEPDIQPAVIRPYSQNGF